MISIQRAQEKDSDAVYSLFQQYFAQVRYSREQWRRLFKRTWQVADDSCGLLLLDGEKVRGFLGTIYSERCFDGRMHRLCNMTSWVVADDSRMHSLKLLLELLKLSDCTLTNFTPSPGVAALLERTGFKEISAGRLFLWPAPWPPGSPFSARLIADPVLRVDQSYCYMVTTRSTYRRFPVAKIHYLSHPERFNRWPPWIRMPICVRLKVFGLVTERRFFQSISSFATSIPVESRTFYRSGCLQPRQIDTLYSEMIMLHGSAGS